MQLYKVDLEGFDEMAQPYNIRFVEEKIDVVKAKNLYISRYDKEKISRDRVNIPEYNGEPLYFTKRNKAYKQAKREMINFALDVIQEEINSLGSKVNALQTT